MCRIHIWRGSYEGPHDHDIDFAKVAPTLIKAKPISLVVEAASTRATPTTGRYGAIWKLPDDKILVAGTRPTMSSIRR